MEKHRILFVCMGNICRSPTAEGVFRKLAMQRNLEHLFEIDSAGTGGWHIGSPPDQRAQHAALERNIDLSILRARQVARSDFEYFDSVIAMDRDNLAVLQGLAPQTLHHKIRLLLKSGDSTTGEPSSSGRDSSGCSVTSNRMGTAVSFPVDPRSR